MVGNGRGRYGKRMTWAHFLWIWIQPRMQRLLNFRIWRRSEMEVIRDLDGHQDVHQSTFSFLTPFRTNQRTKKSENIHLTKMIYDELIEMSEPDKRFSLLFTFFIHYVATTFTTLQKRSIFISVGPTTNTPNKNLCSGTWILLTERKWYGLYSTTSMNAPKTFTRKRWSSYNSPKFMGSKLGDDWNILFVCFFPVLLQFYRLS